MNSSKPQQFTIVLDSTQQPIEQIQNNTGLSKQYLKNMATKGAVWFAEPNGKPKRIRRLNALLSKSGTCYLYHNPKVLDEQPKPLASVYICEHYSVWHKPKGMLSQGTKWGDHSAITRVAEQALKQQGFDNIQPILLHRLDKMTSGLILLAHSPKMAKAFTQLFETRSVKKTYQALAAGALSEPQSVATEIDQKPALSHITPIKTSRCKSISWLNIAIETGRKHQIRKHLSSIGHPIVGDRLYALNNHEDHDQKLSQASVASYDLQLTATELEFICPATDKRQTFSCKPDFAPELLGLFN